MAHTYIARIISVQKRNELWITTIEDEDGNTATGIGKDFKPHTPIITYFDDRYNRVKFSLDTAAPQHAPSNDPSATAPDNAQLLLTI